ncbi:MAG: hypothetical protein NTU53_13345 [Planctomycetota bacterium]|nr:hypothetical protein [Planctomycetota bacterium]
MIATTFKVPLLFFLTLLITFPSLYVFNALVGSRLLIRSVLRLLVASLAVILAVRQNILRVVQQLRLSKPLLAELVHARKITILPCLYNLHSGRVTLLTPPTPATNH